MVMLGGTLKRYRGNPSSQIVKMSVFRDIKDTGIRNRPVKA